MNNKTNNTKFVPIMFHYDLNIQQEHISIDELANYMTYNFGKMRNQVDPTTLLLGDAYNINDCDVSRWDMLDYYSYSA